MHNESEYQSFGDTEAETYTPTTQDQRNQTKAEGMVASVKLFHSHVVDGTKLISHTHGPYEPKHVHEPDHGPQQPMTLAPAQAEKVRQILGNRPPPHMLVRWRVRLLCGHTIELRRHVTNTRPFFYGTAAEECRECDRDPVLVVAARPLGLVGEPPKEPAVPKAVLARKKRRLKALEVETKALRAELQEPS